MVHFVEILVNKNLYSHLKKCDYISFLKNTYLSRHYLSLPHTSDAFSLEFSILAILEPNCIARFGRQAESVMPSCLAATRSKSFSPTPLGNVRFVCTGKKIMNKEKGACNVLSEACGQPCFLVKISILTTQNF